MKLLFLGYNQVNYWWTRTKFLHIATVQHKQVVDVCSRYKANENGIYKIWKQE